jgi:hypothetical protein
MYWSNILAWINIATKLFTIPGVVGVVDLKVAWLSGRRRLLISILGVSKDDDKPNAADKALKNCMHSCLMQEAYV